MSRASDTAVPRIDGIIETALYADDLPRAVAFYDDLFGFPHLFESERLVALDVGGRSVLLLFLRGGSAEAQDLPGGRIPAHDGQGPLHMAFAIPKEALGPWEARLQARGIEISGRVTWPKGGESLYFRDPDGHMLEIATPGLWKTY